MSSRLLDRAARPAAALVAAGDGTHQPPASVKSNGQRALDLIRDGKAGPGFTDVGRQRAKQLAAGDPVSTDVVRRMADYFARHDEGDQGKQHQNGTPANVAWLAWGGDAGKRWAESVVKQLDGQATTASAAPATEITAVPDGDSWRFDFAAATSVLVAAAFPVKPPAAWFDDPKLDKPTSLVVTADGHVYGHVADWTTRHIGLPGNQTAPRSAENYRWFRTGQVETDDGAMVNTGRITMGAGHAGMDGNITAAVEHYDDVSTAVADVSCGEDRHGIWVAGALRPNVTDEQVRALRASVPSGDWRPQGRSLEMCAVHIVNTGGFPIPRAAVAASGEITALVAAGAIPREPMVASTWDEAAHPRGTGAQGGQWVAKDSAGANAQKDKNSQKQYGQLEGKNPAQAKAMLGKLSDADLKKLTEFAYSSKTSNPKIVAARIAVANEMGRRGFDIKKHGALGGGITEKKPAAHKTTTKKRATRASATTEEGLVAAPTPPASTPSDGPGPTGMVSVGDTGLVGQVTDTTDDGQVVVEVTVPQDEVHAASDEDAVAAAAKLTERQQMRSLTASVEALRQDLAARDRADAARTLLASVPQQ